MSEAREYENRVSEALQRAVAKALERKRRLGQYAVFWENGRPVCVGPDAPAGQARTPNDRHALQGDDTPPTADQ